MCSSSGVLPRSSSPWLKTLLNSRNKSSSCCCWSSERHSGNGRWRGGPGREEACQPASPPRGRQYSVLSEAGEAQVGDYEWQSRGLDHWRALECLSQMPAESRQDKTKTSSAGHGLWQRTRRAISGGMSAVCSSKARLAAWGGGGTR